MAGVLMARARRIVRCGGSSGVDLTNRSVGGFESQAESRSLRVSLTRLESYYLRIFPDV